MQRFSKYLDPELILLLDVPDRDTVLHALVNQLHQRERIVNPDQFFQAIAEREKIVSTSIGMGVAIPHAKIAGFHDFFIAIGILNKGVDWNALDGSPVRLVFLIGGPDDRQTEYLQILSGLTLAIKDEERRKKLLTLNSPKAIMSLFKAF